jgi:hypothetical protein
MKEYHKIETIFERDMVTNKLVEGSFRKPEFEYLANLKWIGTEKVDGTNIRIMWDGVDIKIGGKTDNAQIHKDLITRLEELFFTKKEVFIEKFGEKQVCLYGEGYGAGIQTGGRYKSTKDFVLFDVLINEYWLDRGNVQGIADMFGVDIVPIVREGTLYELVDMVKSGFKSNWGDFVAEGIVARPVVELTNKFGERIITKIKYRDF